ncbi:uncharacterized protein LOC143618953 [Bidens hawaiensis]|uniref:uncharacterized protein LOC143618953 n=1 Tax=Bidens hawaiensis TaxID=980011 RepID=UPI00404A0EAC
MSSSCDDEFTLITDTTTPNPTFHHHHHFSAAAAAHLPPESILHSTDSSNYTDDGSGTTPRSYSKKAKVTNNITSNNSSSDYRKDREEWSDGAIACLLDAYLEKFVELNRGNLRVRDWEEVAVSVSENRTKSVEQCKNKVDNLKKRFKLERNRSVDNTSGVSHWPWYKKMEMIVGSSVPVKSAGEEDKGVGVGGVSASGRQSKRYTTATSSPSGQITNMEPKSVASPRWQRVVFKISGAALGGTGSESTDPKVAMLIAREVSLACQMGVEVAIVVGGRNFFCGDSWVSATNMDRSTAYQIGMMATMMNSILLQSTLEKLGVQARVQSAFSLPDISEPYNRQRAIRHLEKGRVVIFGGISAGIGIPLFSDTAAALRASELHADAVIKGTNLHGICEVDTISSVAYEHISFRELASRGSSQIDMMAATFCEENSIPVVIFSLHEPGNISRVLSGESIGTLIDRTGRIG